MRKRTFEELELGLDPSKYGKMTGKKLKPFNPWDIKKAEDARASEEGKEIDRRILEMLKSTKGLMSEEDKIKMQKMQYDPNQIDTFDEDPEIIYVPIK